VSERLKVEEEAARAAEAVGRLDVTAIVQATVEALPHASRLYPDIYAHKVTEALIKAGIIPATTPNPHPDCPVCGEQITWDSDHDPHAWRHVRTITRWCEPGDRGMTPGPAWNPLEPDEGKK